MTTQKPAIMYETGLDEAFLVGTRAELTAFAEAIPGALQSDSSRKNIFGVPAQWLTGAFTEPMADVVLDAILVVEGTDERRLVMNEILKNNGESPIARQGREWSTCRQYGVRLRRSGFAEVAARRRGNHIPFIRESVVGGNR